MIGWGFSLTGKVTKMTHIEFAEYIKKHAKMKGIQGLDLEAAAGQVLTDTARSVLRQQNDEEVTRHIITLLGTIMSTIGVTTEHLTDPRFVENIGAYLKHLDNVGAGETLQ